MIYLGGIYYREVRTIEWPKKNYDLKVAKNIPGSSLDLTVYVM